MNKYRKYIFTGIMSIIPLTITYWIIQYLFVFFSGPGKIFINLFYKSESINNVYLYRLAVITEHLAGFVLTILFLYFLGIVISNVVGKRLYIYILRVY